MKCNICGKEFKLYTYYHQLCDHTDSNSYLTSDEEVIREIEGLKQRLDKLTDYINRKVIEVL